MELEYSQFNAFDLLIVVTLVFSILIGVTRGFVRELFGLSAWGGAFFIAQQDYQWPKDFFIQWIKDPIILQAVGFFLVFCIALIMFLCLAQWLSMLIQKSFAKTVDQSLGLVFGFLRGLCVICVSYLGSLLLFSADKIPTIVHQSKSIAWLNQGVLLSAPLLPKSLRNNPILIENLEDLKPTPIDSQQLTHSLSAPPPEPVQ